jgi:hypothetical protein
MMFTRRQYDRRTGEAANQKEGRIAAEWVEMPGPVFLTKDLIKRGAEASYKRKTLCRRKMD